MSDQAYMQQKEQTNLSLSRTTSPEKNLPQEKYPDFTVDSTQMEITYQTNYPDFDVPIVSQRPEIPSQEPTFDLEFGSDFENSQK